MNVWARLAPEPAKKESVGANSGKLNPRLGEPTVFYQRIHPSSSTGFAGSFATHTTFLLFIRRFLSVTFTPPLLPPKNSRTHFFLLEMAPTTLTKDLKRKRGDDDHDKKAESAPAYKQRVLLLSSRGISQRQRHLMNDLASLLPHSKRGQ